MPFQQQPRLQFLKTQTSVACRLHENHPVVTKDTKHTQSFAHLRCTVMRQLVPDWGNAEILLVDTPGKGLVKRQRSDGEIHISPEDSRLKKVLQQGSACTDCVNSASTQEKTVVSAQSRLSQWQFNKKITTDSTPVTCKIEFLCISNSPRCKIREA